MKRNIIQRITLLVLLLLVMDIAGFAQGRRTERVQSLKVGYISDRVKLTSSQAEKFWPVYRSYETELRTLRQRFMQQRKDQRNLNEEQARKYIDANLDYQDAVVDLKRRYKTEFLKIISAQQLTELYVAEREFRQMLIQRLRDRKGKRK